MRGYFLPLAVLGVICAAALPQDATGPAAPAPPDWNDCLACHKLAGQDLPRLSDLRAGRDVLKIESSCYGCHTRDDLQRVSLSWLHPVRPIAAHVACTDCHPAVAHGAGNPPPLPEGDYLAEGCYACHRTVEAERMLFFSHPERQPLQCRECHPPHEPFQAALPISLIPTLEREARQRNYDWYQSNSLCLGCHSLGTLFWETREGFALLNTENYHERHVIKGQVMCVECHESHGSTRKAMLRTRLLSGELLGFSETIKGGRCSALCHGVDHEEFSYSTF